ncbi:MAG: hypothetical protein RIQ81_2450 [Pseudomonadota bacterium]
MTGPAVSPASICQIEIPVSDLQASLKFYEHVFGWRRSPAEIQEYVVLESPDPEAAIGVSLIPGATPAGRNGHAHTVLYFKVQNPDEIAARAVTWGGTKRFGPRKVPSYGEIWRITDPDGNQFGLFKGR